MFLPITFLLLIFLVHHVNLMNASCMRLFQLFFLLMLCNCGYSSVSIPFDVPDSRFSYWESEAEYCGSYPSKDLCDDGDMVLFGGLLCAAGDQRGCQLVHDSQDESGRFWRSPRRNPGNLGERRSFSRDQASGVFLYLASTRDQRAATSWLSWIESSRPCLVRDMYGNCLLWGPHRYCTDEDNQMCTINPANWAIMARIFRALDLPLNAEMKAFQGVDTPTMVAESKLAPLGYQLHLVGVEVLLKKRLGETPSENIEVANTLLQRQPENPFFSYLAGASAKSVESRILELCPNETMNEPFRHRQWAWERDTSEQAWRESMLWDCIFLAKLIIQ